MWQYCTRVDRVSRLWYFAFDNECSAEVRKGDNGRFSITPYNEEGAQDFGMVGEYTCIGLGDDEADSLLQVIANLDNEGDIRKEIEERISSISSTSDLRSIYKYIDENF